LTGAARTAIGAAALLFATTAIAGGCSNSDNMTPRPPGTGGAGGTGSPGGAGGAGGGGAGTDNLAPGAAEDPAIAAILTQANAAAIDRSNPLWRTRLPRPTAATFTAGKTYVWRLATDKGELIINFRPDVAPMHVTSTIYLTVLGFYDTLTFHRIIKGFMAQGGDPLGNGRGSPGYAYAGEFSPSATHDGRGVLSMANAGPNTDGSQFFVTFSAQPGLDGKHTVFGKLAGGLDALAAIEAGGTAGEGTPQIARITRASVAVE
jgi:peptidyl-prolyl cis-trans isomerase B (cyclophilin B)